MEGIKRIIQMREKKAFVYYHDKNNQILYIPREIYEKCIALKIEFDSKPKIIQERNCYSIPLHKLQELEEKSEYKGIEQIVQIQKGKREKQENYMFAYQDGRTKVIYLPEKYREGKSANAKTILNEKCYPITERELEAFLNKKIIIATVYCKPEEIEKIQICRTKDSSFIKEMLGVKYGLNIKNRKRIRIEGTIYVQVTEEELTLMQIISKKEAKIIEFEKREIVPKR